MSAAVSQTNNNHSRLVFARENGFPVAQAHLAHRSQAAAAQPTDIAHHTYQHHKHYRTTLISYFINFTPTSRNLHVFFPRHRHGFSLIPRSIQPQELPNTFYIQDDLHRRLFTKVKAGFTLKPDSQRETRHVLYKTKRI